MEDTYLGDGVFASFDGFQIWLDTRGQTPCNRIALEPEVFASLLAYEKKVKEVAAAAAQQAGDLQGKSN